MRNITDNKKKLIVELKTIIKKNKKLIIIISKGMVASIVNKKLGM